MNSSHKKDIQLFVSLMDTIHDYGNMGRVKKEIEKSNTNQAFNPALIIDFLMLAYMHKNFRDILDIKTYDINCNTLNNPFNKLICNEFYKKTYVNKIIYRSPEPESLQSQIVKEYINIDKPIKIDISVDGEYKKYDDIKTDKWTAIDLNLGIKNGDDISEFFQISYEEQAKVLYNFLTKIFKNKPIVYASDANQLTKTYILFCPKDKRIKHSTWYNGLFVKYDSGNRSQKSGGGGDNNINNININNNNNNPNNCEKSEFQNYSLTKENKELLFIDTIKVINDHGYKLLYKINNDVDDVYYKINISKESKIQKNGLGLFVSLIDTVNRRTFGKNSSSKLSSKDKREFKKRLEELSIMSLINIYSISIKNAEPDEWTEKQTFKKNDIIQLGNDYYQKYREYNGNENANVILSKINWKNINNRIYQKINEKIQYKIIKIKELIIYEGKAYKCLEKHKFKEFIYDYWEEQEIIEIKKEDFTYLTNDFVIVNKKTYQCIKNNTPIFDNKPPNTEHWKIFPINYLEKDNFILALFDVKRAMDYLYVKACSTANLTELEQYVFVSADKAAISYSLLEMCPCIHTPKVSISTKEQHLMIYNPRKVKTVINNIVLKPEPNLYKKINVDLVNPESLNRVLEKLEKIKEEKNNVPVNALVPNTISNYTKITRDDCTKFMKTFETTEIDETVKLPSVLRKKGHQPNKKEVTQHKDVAGLIKFCTDLENGYKSVDLEETRIKNNAVKIATNDENIAKNIQNEVKIKLETNIQNIKTKIADLNASTNDIEKCLIFKDILGHISALKTNYPDYDIDKLEEKFNDTKMNLSYKKADGTIMNSKGIAVKLGNLKPTSYIEKSKDYCGSIKQTGGINPNPNPLLRFSSFVAKTTKPILQQPSIQQLNQAKQNLTTLLNTVQNPELSKQELLQKLEDEIPILEGIENIADENSMFYNFLQAYSQISSTMTLFWYITFKSICFIIDKQEL